MRASRYKLIISKTLKNAQILNQIDKILFEPSGRNSFNMLWYVPSANDNIRFGILNIDPKFIDFLNSGQAPAEAPGPDKAYDYLKTYDLTFDRNTFSREYDKVNRNLKILMSGDPNAINEFQKGSINEIGLLDMTLDTDKGSPRHNELLQAYMEWSGEKGYVSEAVPFMAKRKQSIKISHREND